MPDDLAGLCKLRVGSWRILYWIYHADKIVRIVTAATEPGQPTGSRILLQLQSYLWR
jgi:hypothetical protein